MRNFNNSGVFPLSKCHVDRNKSSRKSLFVDRNRISKINGSLGVFDYEALKKQREQNKSR